VLYEIITPINAPKNIYNFILKNLLHVSALLGHLRCLRGVASRDTSQTEDEAQGTFELNSINATRLYQYYSPRIWPSRAETCRKFLRIKLYIFFGALVGVIISYNTVDGHGTY
jgi:hypothetical protein